MRPVVKLATRSKALLAARGCSASPRRPSNRPQGPNVGPIDHGSGPMSWLTRLNRGDNDIDFLKVWKRTLIVSVVLVVISILRCSPAA